MIRNPITKKTEAVTFSQNSTKTGHIGYYANNKRDTSDWYKITTTADGLLNLKLTPANGSFTYINLYDNNGTTLLKSAYSNASFTLSMDGLAAGTYYVKINCYYNNQFSPYTLINNLVLPAESNDAEPNNTRAQAITLAINSKKTGHTGYYYNNKRDSSDWYKITTTTDGLLKLKLTPANGSFVWVYLYDNNGTTLLNSSYSNTPFSQSTDGLAAGTYYVKVNCYYNNQFTPYTLTDSLAAYSTVSETEQNKRPFQGKTISSSTTATGHVGFYYNKVRDTLDWWKLNYTGSGSLQLGFKLTPKKIDGVIPYVWFYVYKDTLKSPIYATYFNTASNVISLSALSKTTYYIKIIPYYPNDFAAYSISNPSTASALTMLKAGGSNFMNNEKGLSNNILVYPNPASSMLHVQATGEPGDFVSMVLRDAEGKEVWKQSGNSLFKISGKIDLDVKAFPNGIYFLQITDKGNRSIIKEIVIQK